MDFYENIGGFLFVPRMQSERILKRGLNNQDYRHAWGITGFAWLFLGSVVMFLYLYPELLYFGASRTVLQKSGLYVTILGQPLLIIGILLLILIFVLSINNQGYGRINYVIGKKIGLNIYSLSKEQFRVLYSYTILPFFIWGVFGVIRMFFGEKIHIADYAFPFFIWSIQNILYWSLFALCLGYKFYIGMGIQKASFGITGKKILICPAIELGLFLALLGIIAIVGGSLSSIFLG